jgi:hypothetical protein
MSKRSGLPSVDAEFEAADLGDERLNRRLSSFATAFANAPDKSFPQMASSESELEAHYRLLGNERVDFGAILAPHVAQSVARTVEAKRVLVVHDTTSFTLKGERGEEVGYLNTTEHGFYFHASVAVVADGESRACLGVLGAHDFSRTNPPAARGESKKRSGAELAKQPTREADRWGNQILKVEQLVNGGAELIHVTDSEGHKYWLLEMLKKKGHRFIIRLAREHKAKELGDEEWDLVSNLVGRSEDVATREVPLPARATKRPPRTKKRFPDRRGREAKLHFGRMQLALKRPPYLDDDVAAETVVNVVRVYETNAPAGVEPVEWILFTSEPIDTAEQVLTVVDQYRKRWVVEDFFRALKTGTSYEERQLEGAHSWKNALAISLPIAWRLLAIRTASREEPEAPATTIFTAAELAALKHRLPKRLSSKNPTRREAFLALAEYGGHIKNNGEPGWQILYRAWTKILPLVEGIERGLELGRKM